jgi:pimeloyl-ACP methyl ester carboxylesterase
MRDLIITLPGIMGSQLSRGDTSEWNPGLGFVKKLLRHKSWIAGLVLDPDDDPTQPLAPDGIVPTLPTGTVTIIPGLFEIDGYTELDKAVRTTFGNDLIEGDPLHPTQRRDGLNPQQKGVPNYYQFAYDWRRDVRSASMRLHDLIETALPALIKQRSPSAKVVLIGHSMGGLVARYYLYGTDLRTGEPFRGWEKVREAITLATPYRGSADALNYLLHGHKQLFVDFTEAVRSFPSIYHLLPRYRLVHDQRGGAAPDSWLYPHDLAGFSGFDPARARSAYEDFHGVIDRGLETADASARRLTTPHVAFGHPTANSFVVTDRGFTMGNSAPGYLDKVYDGGDGTVPLISAIPLELDDERAGLRYLNQRHGSVQADRRLLQAEIQQRLKQSQRGTSDARGTDEDGTGAPAVGIAGPSFFPAGEQPYAELSVSGTSPDGVVTVSVTDLAPGGQATTLQAAPGARVDLPAAPGDYRVEVSYASPSLTSTAFYAVVDPDAPDQD